MKQVQVWLAVLLLCWAAVAKAAEEKPKALSDIDITPTLGSQLPLDEEFVDESGKTVKLGSYFDGKQPVVIILNYYGCPLLCGVLLNVAQKSFQGINWLPGHQYKIVTISFDPKEKFELAAGKKKSMTEAATNPEFKAAMADGWHFLVGKSGSEARLASALGFHYKWIEEDGQWAHGTALFLASPSGMLSRVMLGLDFPPRDLKLALLETGEGKVGTFAEKLVLFCYHWEPKDNKFVLLASRLMMIGGALTVVALVVAYLLWFLRDRRKGNACSL